MSAIAIRYRLRTLLIGAAILPPVLALMWYIALWLRFALPDILAGIVQPLLWPCASIGVGLACYAVAAPPPGQKPAVVISWSHACSLISSLFLVLWQWLWVFSGMAGWMFLWGDNGPPYSPLIMLLVPAAAAGCCTALTGIRLYAGLATPNYVLVLWSLIAVLGLVAGLLWLVIWLR